MTHIHLGTHTHTHTWGHWLPCQALSLKSGRAGCHGLPWWLVYSGAGFHSLLQHPPPFNVVLVTLFWPFCDEVGVFFPSVSNVPKIVKQFLCYSCRLPLRTNRLPHSSCSAGSSLHFARWVSLSGLPHSNWHTCAHDKNGWICWLATVLSGTECGFWWCC